MASIPDLPEDAFEYHILGRVDDPESVARCVIEEATPGAVVVDLSAGQLNSPHQPHRKTPVELLDSITWINGQHFAPEIGDASRNAYIKWLSEASDQSIAHGKSIKEWFTYKDEVSLWWFTQMSVKHPIRHPYRWLFYQIHVIRHVAEKADSDEICWHVWTSNTDEARALQAAVPDAYSTETHVCATGDTSSWTHRVKEMLTRSRLGETLLALRRGAYWLSDSAQHLYDETRRTSHISHLNGSRNLHSENREQPLVLIRTGFPNSWVGTRSSDQIREGVEWHDHYLTDAPWRLQNHGYTVGWLPYTLQAEEGHWEQARKGQTLPDATPWMNLAMQDAGRIFFHKVKWVFLYIWLFVWRRAHEDWTYEGIPLGAWLKSAYRGVWSIDAFMEIEQCRAACEALRPEVVLYRDEFYGSGRRVAAAVTDSTTTVGLQHGMINREHTVYQWSSLEIEKSRSEGTPDHVHHAPVPDWFAAFGTYYKEQFRKWNGYPAERVLPVGGLRHDRLVEQFNLSGSADDRADQKRQIRASRGLPRMKPVILLCTGIVEQIKDWFRTVVQGLRREGLDAFVAVKLHQYHGGASRVRAVARNCDFSSFSIYREDVYSLMAASDLLVGGGSTVLLEGNLFGLQCTAIRGEKTYPLYPYEQENFAEIATTASEMGEALRRGCEKTGEARSDPTSLRRHLRNADGNACRRLAKALRQRTGREYV